MNRKIIDCVNSILNEFETKFRTEIGITFKGIREVIFNQNDIIRSLNSRIETLQKHIETKEREHAREIENILYRINNPNKYKVGYKFNDYVVTSFKLETAAMLGFISTGWLYDCTNVKTGARQTFGESDITELSKKK